LFRYARLLFLIGLALSACGVETLAPKEDLGFVKHVVNLFQTRDFAAIEALLDPKLKDAQLHANLEKVAEFIPKDPPLKIETVSWDVNSSGGVTTEGFQLQYQFPSQWLVVSIVLEKRDKATLITGLHVSPLTESLQSTNGLTFANINSGKVAFLVLAVVSPLFILFSLVVCIRTRMSKWKWLWIVFILFGAGQFTLNWTTGDLNIQPLAFLLFGAGFSSGGYSAPAISVGFPLGAVLFLVFRRHWRQKARHETVQQF